MTLSTGLAGFNRVVEHHPARIVAAADDGDVRAAVRIAAAQDLPVAVQATGHGVTRPADGAVLIDTRPMTDVRVDPVARTARVAAGVRWRRVIDLAAPHGLAPLNGSSPLVGVVGYTLGGGLGPLGRVHGYAADHVRSIEVVTADGESRTATAEQNPDLFWALRGGKSNFGVVTALEFDLMPVSRLYGGGLYYAGGHAERVLRAWWEWTAAGLPEEMTSSVALLRLPPVPAVPEPLRGRLTVHVRIAFLGDADTGERLVRPLREAAPPLLGSVTDMPYEEVAAIHNDPTEPNPYHERSVMLGDLDGPAVDTLLHHAGAGADRTDFMVELRHLGGALGRPPRVPNAVGNRDASYVLGTVTPDGAERPPVLEAMGPWGTGGRYLNFLSGPDTVDQTRDAYDPASYDRLRAIKGVYDPRNLFRINHNIPPAGMGE